MQSHSKMRLLSYRSKGHLSPLTLGDVAFIHGGEEPFHCHQSACRCANTDNWELIPQLLLTLVVETRLFPEFMSVLIFRTDSCYLVIN